MFGLKFQFEFSRLRRMAALPLVFSLSWEFVPDLNLVLNLVLNLNLVLRRAAPLALNLPR